MVETALWGRRVLSSKEINIHCIYSASGLDKPNLGNQGHLCWRRGAQCPLSWSCGTLSSLSLPGRLLYKVSRTNPSFLCAPTDFSLLTLNHCTNLFVLHLIHSFTQSTRDTLWSYLPWITEYRLSQTGIQTLFFVTSFAQNMKYRILDLMSFSRVSVIHSEKNVYRKECLCNTPLRHHCPAGDSCPCFQHHAVTLSFTKYILTECLLCAKGCRVLCVYEGPSVNKRDTGLRGNQTDSC